MPLGIVSDGDYGKEVDSAVIVEKNKVGKIVEKKAGRPEGKKNVPEVLRKVIAGEAVENGRKAGIKLAQQFAVSSSQVDAYKNGATSLASYNQKEPGLVDHVVKTKEKIVNNSASKCLTAIEKIDLDQPKKARAISAIARDMSTIIKQMSPEESVNVGFGPNFIFYAPQMKPEEDYEVINSDD